MHAAGHTVLLPRLPHHGLKDRRGHDLGRLTPDDLCVTANDAIDVGAGLGERVVFAGISLGAVVAAWAALHRSDVHRVVLIAPLFAVAGFPTWCSDAAGWASTWLPRFYIWWDRSARDKAERPEYAYPGFPSRAGGAALRLGAEVRRLSESQPSAVEDIRLVLNDGDPAANYEPVERLMRRWERQGARVRTKHFPAELQLRHDFVSVEQPGQRPEQTYPALIDWLTADVPST